MISNINPIDYYWTLSDVIKSQKQTRNCWFARAAVTDDRYTLIWFDSKVKFTKHISATAWVSEKYISEFYATIQLHNISWLFRINSGWFLDYSKYCACSLLGFRNTWHLADANTTADRSHKYNVAASENALWVESEPLYKYSSNVEHKSDENKSYWCGVAEEKTTNVGSLDVCQVRNYKKLGVSVQNKLQIFLAKRDYSPIIHDDII